MKRRTLPYRARILLRPFVNFRARRIEEHTVIFPMCRAAVIRMHNIIAYLLLLLLKRSHYYRLKRERVNHEITIYPL